MGNEIKEFLVTYDLLNRLNVLEVKNTYPRKWNNSLNKLDLSSEPMTKLIDPNFLKSCKAVAMLELLNEVLEGKSQNGIFIDHGWDLGTSQDAHKFPLFDNIAFAASFARDFHDVKRLVFSS